MDGDLRICEERSRTNRLLADTEEIRYDAICTKEFLPSPTLALAYNAATQLLCGGHGEAAGSVTHPRCQFERS